jgi:hypothetical protein
MFNEYLQAGSLQNVAKWADSVQRAGVIGNPLTRLINMLKSDRQNNTADLISPVYDTFLRSREGKDYLRRPHILFPMIYGAFEEVCLNYTSLLFQCWNFSTSNHSIILILRKKITKLVNNLTLNPPKSVIIGLWS